MVYKLPNHFLDHIIGLRGKIQGFESVILETVNKLKLLSSFQKQ